MCCVRVCVCVCVCAYVSGSVTGTGVRVSMGVYVHVCAWVWVCVGLWVWVQVGGCAWPRAACIIRRLQKHGLGIRPFTASRNCLQAWEVGQDRGELMVQRGLGEQALMPGTGHNRYKLTLCTTGSLDQHSTCKGHGTSSACSESLGLVHP